MNNSSNRKRESEIDLVDLIWKLLMQWKAVILVCITMALLVTGVKHIKDMQMYKAALEDRKTAEKQASKPAEERIADALDALPESDRQSVIFYVKMTEAADLEQNYLDKSILMNEDPANQRTLTVYYLIKSDSEASINTLADSYNAGLKNDDFMGRLRDVIKPDAELEYIYELVNNNYGIIAPDYTDTNSMIFPVSIVLKDDTDEALVIELIDSTMDSLHKYLNISVGSHSIQKNTYEDAHVYNRYASERKDSILNNINTINNNIKNKQATLSPEQQSAADMIIAIKRSSEEINDKSKTDKDNSQIPGYSKKYALLGFFLGIFIYAGIYIVTLMFKKVVASARTAQSFTGARLLGEIYRKVDRKGIEWLFTSDLVARWRYKDKLDVNKQSSALADTVDAVCTHHGIEKLTLMLSGVDEGFGDIVDRIVSQCSLEGNITSINLINADNKDEKAFGTVQNAVYVVTSKTKFDGLSQMMSLARDYDVATLGTVYLEEI